MSWVITYEKQPLVSHEDPLKQGLFTGLQNGCEMSGETNGLSHTIPLACSFGAFHSLQIFPKTVLKKNVLYSRKVITVDPEMKF